MMDRPVYIYVLKDPRNGDIRYVGKTEQKPEVRLRRHVCDSRHRNSHRDLWISKLLSEGVKPDIEVIETCNQDNWQQRECFWIAHYRLIADLTNTHPGGLGGEGIIMRSLWTPEMREKASAKMKAVCSDGNIKIKRSQNAKKMWGNPEYRERMLSSGGGIKFLSKDAFNKRSKTMKEKCSASDERLARKKRALAFWSNPSFREKAISRMREVAAGKRNAA